MRAYQKLLLVMLSTVVLLVGCASSAERPPQEISAFPDEYVHQSELGDEFLRHGYFTSPSNISQVSSGTIQADVEEHLGQPVLTREDEEGQQWWFYNISFLLAEDIDDLLICQYRVALDDQRHVTQTMWRRPQCHNLYTQSLGTQGISFSGDTLFSFDSAELTFGGRHELDNIVSLIATDFQDPHIKVVGHTGTCQLHDTLIRR
jgi:outer membrane protein assembly factor BamE (lipoprotein component of BamABCDE complex)